MRFDVEDELVLCWIFCKQKKKPSGLGFDWVSESAFIVWFPFHHASPGRRFYASSVELETMMMIGARLFFCAPQIAMADLL